MVTTVATGTAQLTLAAGLTAWDAMRKRRTAQVLAAPSTPPLTEDVRGTTVTTYTYGEHVYDAMVEAIEAAEDHVYLASYIWKGDTTGRRVKDAVVAAARRGVMVCVVFDGFANLVVPPSFQRFPAPVHVLRFPMLRGLPLVDVRRTGRDHRKVLVVDGRVGFVGGYNIGSTYATQWRDTHVRLEGPAVWELANTFTDFWNRHRRRVHPMLPDSGASQWDPGLRAARNEPSRLVYPVRGLYLEAIDRSRERIWLTQAYFIPDKEILEALLAAAARGVDVRLITPERSNHVVADWVARSFVDALLRGGVRIHLYQDAMVHAKTATVDGVWTTVGTANIDRLSLLGNYEVNLEVTHQGQARVMEQIFGRDLENCRELTLREWEERGLARRVGERILRPLQPLL